MKTFLSFLVLILVASVSFWFYAHKPQTKKIKPQRPVPMVKAISVQASSESVVFEAALLASTRRFRPIMLTSLTTFFGLAPMIFE